jgi:hypothetical protein
LGGDAGRGGRAHRFAGSGAELRFILC